MALQDLRLTAINLATEAPCVTDFPLPPELQSQLGNGQGTYPFPSEERYQVAFEPNQENVAEVLLVNSNASSMRIGTTIVANAIGPRLRPHNLDVDPRIDLRTYIDNMYLCVTLPDNQDACEMVEAPVTTTDLEGLAMIINHAAELRPLSTSTDGINDVSSVLLNTSGHFTIAVKGLLPLNDLFAQGRSHPYASLGGLQVGGLIANTNIQCTHRPGSAFSLHYGTGQCGGQVSHFWSYLTSFANDPDNNLLIGVSADVVHECMNSFGTEEDARLTSVAFYISEELADITPAVLAEGIRLALSSQLPPGLPGALAPWYYVIPSCRPLAEREWSDRDPGQSIPPELQCWIGQASLQCSTN